VIRRHNIRNPYAQTVKVGVVIIAVFAIVAFFTPKEDTKPQAPPITIGLSSNSIAEVYFSPKGGCTEAIIKAVSGAKESIYVQAYSFTSQSIAEALVGAKKRGVRVSVILDHSQKNDKSKMEDLIAAAGVRTMIDAKHSIAHNKVIIIDEQTVLTGSFNFSKAAEEANAENLLVVHDADLARKYLANWTLHENHSADYTTEETRK
jgi:phosphatidylserine/phosphatidylglycerophosphate/cardiolipin synthase-like enzyme